MTSPASLRPIWTPSLERVQASQMYRWMRALQAQYGFPLAGATDYAGFHRWTVEHVAEFWGEVWADAGIAASRAPTGVLTDAAMPPDRSCFASPDALSGVPAREVWFPGARFNFAQHLLRHRDDRVALIAEAEPGGPSRRSLTYRELYRQAAAAAAAFRALGVRLGDRVAAFMPNTVETIVAMLGATSLGAIWSSTSPDFGFQGVLDRFGQIDPKVLVCADGYRYNGTAHVVLDKASRLAEEIPSIEKVVVVPFLGAAGESGRHLPGALDWSEFIAHGAQLAEQTAGEPSMDFAQLPFDHPVYILYSSGTTGAPKCIVHGAGGTLLKHHVEHKFHCDVGRADTLFYFTTCGWMMWNWLAGSLAQGCTAVLYDGSPTAPDAARLFRLAAENGVSILGVSPKFLAGVQKAGVRPRDHYPLPRLRTILSTGAPLEPGQFRFVYEAIHPDIQLASISGGTDLCGCFMAGVPLLPVHAGEIQGPCLGMDLAAFDEMGHPLFDRQGELVCRKPFPSMPVGFWRDPGNAKYRTAYFADYPGVWRHGDFVTIHSATGGLTVFGRSDATLNPGGVRIGTAEIYRAVEALPEVLDSIVVGHKAGGDEEIALFVVLTPGLTLDAALEQRLRDAVRAQATPRHVPKHIRQIPQVPVTINGKKVELAVAAILRGERIQNRDALANPEALQAFESLRL
ncbi:MAG: acetoacetate--CoA ligase [SAR324 cluster bacterium]